MGLLDAAAGIIFAAGKVVDEAYMPRIRDVDAFGGPPKFRNGYRVEAHNFDEHVRTARLHWHYEALRRQREAKDAERRAAAGAPIQAAEERRQRRNAKRARHAAR